MIKNGNYGFKMNFVSRFYNQHVLRKDCLNNQILQKFQSFQQQFDNATSLKCEKDLISLQSRHEFQSLQNKIGRIRRLYYTITGWFKENRWCQICRIYNRIHPNSETNFSLKRLWDESNQDFWQNITKILNNFSNIDSFNVDEIEPEWSISRETLQKWSQKEQPPQIELLFKLVSNDLDQSGELIEQGLLDWHQILVTHNKSMLIEKAELSISQILENFLKEGNLDGFINLCQKLENQPISSLTLVGVKINDQALEALSKISSLEKIYLDDCRKFTKDGLGHLSGLKKLKILSFTNVKNMIDEMLRVIAKIECLESLNLRLCENITDKGLKHLSELKNLVTLNLGACPNIDGTGLIHLKELKKIRTLYLDESSISNQGMENLSKIEALQLLSLTGCIDIDNEGFKHLSNLSNLKTLNCMGTKITDESLKSLENLKNLKELYLDYCDGIKGPGLTFLKTVTLLSLNSCYGINDQSFGHLRNLQYLESLDIQGCAFVTNACVEHLEALNSLREVKCSFVK